MIYSVYDHSARRWHYYEGVGQVPTTAFFRDAGRGVSPDRLVARLPADAVAVGVGDMPRGVVASRDHESGGLGAAPGDDSGAPSSVLAWVGLAVVVGGAFWLGRKSSGAKERLRKAAREALS